jgi:outer membrane protein OmpA-like peptidoglycan-associated protein/opacity protein-like surface antigen
MKNFVKIFFVFTLALFTTQSWTQDKNNPWQFSFGVSALNFNGTNYTSPSGSIDLGPSLFNEYFNVTDHWNVQSSFSTVTLTRYAENGYSIGFRASVNKFSKLGDTSITPKTIITGDLVLTKTLSALTFCSLEPYIELGAGQSFVGGDNDYHLNAGAGVSYAVSDKVHLKLNTIYRHNKKNNGIVSYVPDIIPHFQHNLSVAINFGGKDTDKDGVYDRHDDCPSVPGLPEFNGCPDDDGDGIENSKDACPNAAGLLEFNGCPDSDGDGIADPNDACPDVAGLAKFNGCPDSDGDGIEDGKDACPNAAGPRKFNGCPDSDGDGIADPDDKCPNEAGPSDNSGCPNPTAEAIEKLNELGAVVQFELNKSNLRDDAIELLLSVYEIMAKYGNTNFLIEGHTDSSGPKAFNKKLSLERAENVKSHLVSKGVEGDRLSTAGFGEDNPKESNNTRKGRIANRRVEFKVVE